MSNDTQRVRIEERYFGLVAASQAAELRHEASDLGEAALTLLREVQPEDRGMADDVLTAIRTVARMAETLEGHADSLDKLRERASVAQSWEAMDPDGEVLGQRTTTETPAAGWLFGGSAERTARAEQALELAGDLVTEAKELLHGDRPA
jgi:hypothetical protein